MRTVVKVVGLVLAALLVVALGGYAWASFAASRKLSRTYTVHTVDFPIPFPLPEAEVRRLQLTLESARLLARDRALESGRHLVESRYACMGCHGRGFGGGVMIDDPAIGRLLRPNSRAGGKPHSRISSGGLGPHRPARHPPGQQAGADAVRGLSAHERS